MANEVPAGMMRFRPLTNFQLSINRQQEALVVVFEARAEEEAEGQTFWFAMSEEQARSVGKALIDGADELA